MKRKFKAYLRLNIMSLFFIGVSFISVTLAWFAYSGIINTKTEIGVKAWHIEFEKNSQTVSNNIVLSLSEIYPGMETVDEVVDIKNLGDSDAQLKYSIKSARILDTTYSVDGSTLTSETLEDSLSHDYPFHINISLAKDYAEQKNGESRFTVSISWPLDSGMDEVDSEWGNDAYTFRKLEEEYNNSDSSYQIRPSINIVVSLTADQYIETINASDMKYNAGDLILYDIANNISCESLSETCIKTHVINKKSTLGENTVLLLPDLYDNYGETEYTNYVDKYNEIVSSWNVNTRYLEASDILNVISNDIVSSVLVRPNLSDKIIGNLSYGSRNSAEIVLATTYNGYFKYDSVSYNYLESNACFWTNTNYSDSKAFAIGKVDAYTSKLYGENKNTICRILPVIIAPKSNIDK